MESNKANLTRGHGGDLTTQMLISIEYHVSVSLSAGSYENSQLKILTPHFGCLVPRAGPQNRILPMPGIANYAKAKRSVRNSTRGKRGVELRLGQRRLIAYDPTCCRRVRSPFVGTFNNVDYSASAQGWPTLAPLSYMAGDLCDEAVSLSGHSLGNVVQLKVESCV